MSATQSSSSPSTSSSQSPTTSPKTSKKNKDSETSKTVQKFSSGSSETLKEDYKSSSGSSQLPKTQKEPLSSTEVPKTLKEPLSSTKVPKTQTGSPGSTEVPEIQAAPPGPTKVPNVLKSPTGSQEAPKTSSKAPPKVSKLCLEDTMFKSSLQVLLQKQEGELVKNLEFKEKIERGEVDEEDEDKEVIRDGRRGSEDGNIDEETNKRPLIMGMKKPDENLKEKKEKITKQTTTKKEDDDDDDDDDACEIKETKTEIQEKIETRKETEMERKEKPANLKEMNEKESTQKGKKDMKLNVKEEKNPSIRNEEVKEEEREDKDSERGAKREKEALEKSTESITDTKKKKKKKEKSQVEEHEEEKIEKEEKKIEVKKKVKKKESMNKKKMQREEKERLKKEAKEKSVGKEEQKRRREEEEDMEKEEEMTKEDRPCGYLHFKRKRTFNPWKEYFFVMENQSLNYYRSLQEYQQGSEVKGFLNLSEVEEVRVKKPGIIKAHHPLCLFRRNLPSYHLATETKEEQERWSNLLLEEIRPRKQSYHNSEHTLNTATTPTEDPKLNKSATLPPRVSLFSRSSSSSATEEEDSEREREKVEEEEPEIIKPQKVMRVPIGMPLVKVNLDEVKLKKIEKKEAKTEEAKEGKAADVPSSTSEHQSQEDISREVSPSQRFGVVLKKAPNKEAIEGKGLHPGERGGSREGSTSPGLSTTSVRRPSKQPVIPLNSRKLLVVPAATDDKLSRASPTIQRRTTPERKKSPSPSLPISKSVQALTKSAEEVKTVKVDNTASFTSASGDGKSKDLDAKLCHAETFELKFGDVMDIVDMEEKQEEITRETSEENEKSTMERNKEVTEEYRKALENTKGKVKENEDQITGQEEAAKQMTKDERPGTGEGREIGRPALKDEMTSVETVDEDSVSNIIESQQIEATTQEDKQKESSIVGDKNEEAEASYPNSCNVISPPTPPASPASNMTSSDLEITPKASLSLSSSSLSSRKPSPSPPLPPSSPKLDLSNLISPSSPKPGLFPPQPSSSPKSSPSSPKSSPSSPKSSPSSPKSGLSSPKLGLSSSKLGPSSPKLGPSSPKSGPSSPKSGPSSSKSVLSSSEDSLLSCDSKDVEEDLRSWVQKESQKAVEEVPDAASRERTNTNESTSSSSSCYEGSEKKLGKLQKLKSKFKVGSSTKDKKEDPAAQKDPKKKRSNSFSIFLQAKKTKEDAKKLVEVEPLSLQQQKDKPITRPHHHDILTVEKSPTKDKAVRDLLTVDVQVTPPPANEPTEEDVQTSLDFFIATVKAADNQMVSLRSSPTCGEARTSTYSYTSTGSQDDPPPTIPEKTFTRARSPKHDVPMNNRPVTHLHMMAPEDEDELEPSLKLDGYISEKQIDALLSATENREKKKRSRSRSITYAQPDVLKVTPSASGLTEPWTIKRPSCTSISSMDSDDPLPTTNFLCFERQLSNSSSLKDSGKADGSQSSSFSESGEPMSPETDGPIEFLRRAPRATDAITVKNRVSLTSPEFTVKEEEGLDSPETLKARPRKDDGHENTEKSSDEDEAEDKDFFPVIGGDVNLRKSGSMDLPKGDLRNSGIVGLKEFLKAQDDDSALANVKPGISRLGHSAAVEKLKQTTSE